MSSLARSPENDTHPDAVFDAHCHLDDPSIADQREGLLTEAREAGVRGFLVAGVSPARWPDQKAFVAQHPDIWTIPGIHPWQLQRLPEGREDVLLEALDTALEDQPVALGEIGLDRTGPHRAFFDRQRAVFRAQLARARDLDLPVVLHMVAAPGPLLDVIRADGLPGAGGMVHGFSGSPESAREFLDVGLHLSFGLRCAQPKTAAALLCTPGDRLLLETDSPFGLWPPSKNKFNSPVNLIRVVQKVAELRDESPTAVGWQSEMNARRLFRLNA